MRLASFVARSDAGRFDWRAGIAVPGAVVDAVAAAEHAALDSDQLSSTRHLLGLERPVLDGLHQAAADLAGEGGAGVYGADAIRLGPPVPDPEKILCLGLNYQDHADEAQMATPVAPVLFAKFPNCLIGDGAAIVLPAASTEIDYEGELAVVIGSLCKGVDAAAALDCVAGYMPFNDVSARDIQLRTPQWTAGKAIDTFGPCGPHLVLGDEVPDPQSLDLVTRLNGQTLQRANTSQMIFPVAEVVSFISQLITLQPGDIICTGTPAGVGFKRNPPIYLKDRDVVEVEIERLGCLKNAVVDPAVAPGSSVASPAYSGEE
jgi:2-keto-4-pentenoate hydratase/2-oxohepta-3-ene-1,7-dioic acid hydratase in catechol pathway